MMYPVTTQWKTCLSITESFLFASALMQYKQIEHFIAFNFELHDRRMFAEYTKEKVLNVSHISFTSFATDLICKGTLYPVH